MNIEQSMELAMQRNREARADYASRFSQLVEAITKGVPYDFDPYPEFGTDTDPKGGGLPEQEGQAGTMGGNDSGEGSGVRPETTGT